MPKYDINIQVIRVYAITVKAANEDSAIRQAYNMRSEEIESKGKCLTISTDYAEAV